MHLKDMYVSLVVIVLIFGLFQYYFRLSTQNNENTRYFYAGWILKMLGSIVLGLVYFYHYKGLDTFEYFQGAKAISEALVSDFSTGLYLLTHSGYEVQNHFCEVSENILDKHILDPDSWVFVRFISILSLITFNSYWAVAIIISSLSFIGNWMLFDRLTNRLTLSRKLSFLAVFGFPLVLLWGSGVVKDALVWGGFSGLLALLIDLYLGKRLNLKWYVVLVLCLLPILVFKIYVLLALIIAIGLTILKSIISKFVSNIMGQISLLLLSCFALVVAMLFIMPIFGDFGQSFQFDQILRTVDNAFHWHTRNVNASIYTFGEYDRSWWYLIKHLPEAVVVTLFRPFVWEVDRITMLPMAVESIILLASFVYVLFRQKAHFFKQYWNDRVLFSGLNFILIFAFWIGITAYNFGALSRYRLPVVVVLAMLILYQFSRGKKSS